MMVCRQFCRLRRMSEWAENLGDPQIYSTALVIIGNRERRGVWVIPGVTGKPLDLSVGKGY